MKIIRSAALLIIVVIAGNVSEGFGAASEQKRAAVLVFNGVEVIDYAGPFEIFRKAGFDVYTVAADSETIMAAAGVLVIPAYTVENAPKPDVIVIPGGGRAAAAAARNDDKVSSWIRDASRHAEHVLLTSGISSGIDASLQVISKMSGKGAAQLAALNVDYHWQPGAYSRAAMADMALAGVFSRNGAGFEHPEGVHLDVLRYEGDRERWSVVWLAMGEAPPAELLRRLDAKLSTKGMWTRQNFDENALQSRWTFTDGKGKRWNGLSSVAPFDGQNDINTVRLEIWGQ